MSTSPKRQFDPTDLLTRDAYRPLRADARRKIAELKKQRRMEVGPFATFYFESYETVRHQIQEMLFIEGGGEGQLDDEVAAYAPLIPQGHELVATVMFEIDEPARRTAALHRIGGIENHTFLQVGGEQIRGTPDPERENTSAEGKASAVQFFHFPFSADQSARFRLAGTQVLLGFDHTNYGHIAVVPEAVRAALAADL